MAAGEGCSAGSVVQWDWNIVCNPHPAEQSYVHSHKIREAMWVVESFADMKDVATVKAQDCPSG